MVGERKQLPFLDWPPDIRRRWEAAFANGNFLDEGGPGAHLAPATRAALQFACASFFRYLQNHCLHVDVDAPQKEINPKVLAAFVDHRRKSASDSSIAIELNHRSNSCFQSNCASASIFTLRSFGRECRGHTRTMAYGFPTKAAPWTTVRDLRRCPAAHSRSARIWREPASIPASRFDLLVDS
jgi:hypothetical protein